MPTTWPLTVQASGAIASTRPVNSTRASIPEPALPNSNSTPGGRSAGGGGGPEPGGVRPSASALLVGAANLGGVEVAHDGGRGEGGHGFLEDFRIAVAARDMGEVEVAHLGPPGKVGGLAGREVTEMPGHLGLDLEIGGLDDKPVNAAAGVDEGVGAATVPDVDEAGAR